MLDALAAHRPAPASYTGNGASPPHALLLAAAHLSGGRPVNAANIDWNTISAADFPNWLRQAPGPNKALGGVKIMFPNKHAVCLHDTPHTQLFAQADRDLCAGCVRVEDAAPLPALSGGSPDETTGAPVSREPVFQSMDD